MVLTDLPSFWWPWHYSGALVKHCVWCSITGNSFPHNQTGAIDFERETTDVKYHIPHIISRRFTISIICHCWYGSWVLGWHCYYSVAISCPALCDPITCSPPGFPVPHHLPELAQTHVHWVGDAVQPSHPLLPPSPLALADLSLFLDYLLKLSFYRSIYMRAQISKGGPYFNSMGNGPDEWIRGTWLFRDPLHTLPDEKTG